MFGKLKEQQKCLHVKHSSQIRRCECLFIMTVLEESELPVVSEHLSTGFDIQHGSGRRLKNSLKKRSVQCFPNVPGPQSAFYFNASSKMKFFPHASYSGY